jgi:hypothetical protein
MVVAIVKIVFATMSLVAVARGWGGKLLQRRFGRSSTRMMATTTVAEAYNDTTKKLREINALEGISGLLGWDEMVLMPTGSSGSRGDQKEALAGVLYDKKTSPELGDNLKRLKGCSELSDVQAANVRDAFKDYTHSTAIPKELAQRVAVLETVSTYRHRKTPPHSLYAVVCSPVVCPCCLPRVCH